MFKLFATFLNNLSNSGCHPAVNNDNVQNGYHLLKPIQVTCVVVQTAYFIFFISFLKCFRLNLTKSSNVLKWMADIRHSTDTECMCVLQGKSLTADSDDVVFTPPKSFSGNFSVLSSSLELKQ